MVGRVEENTANNYPDFVQDLHHSLRNAFSLTKQRLSAAHHQQKTGYDHRSTGLDLRWWTVCGCMYLHGTGRQKSRPAAQYLHTESPEPAKETSVSKSYRDALVGDVPTPGGYTSSDVNEVHAPIPVEDGEAPLAVGRPVRNRRPPLRYGHTTT